MKNILRNKQFDFLLSFVGFISSAVLLCYGLISLLIKHSEKAKQTDGISLSGSSSGFKYESNEQIFVRLVLIASCFLFSVFISRFAQKILFKAINLLFLSTVFIQSYPIAKEGVSAIQDGWHLGSEYSGIEYIIRGLVVLIYVSGLMMLPLILIMIIQIRSLLKEKSKSCLAL